MAENERLSDFISGSWYAASCTSRLSITLQLDDVQEFVSSFEIGRLGAVGSYFRTFNTGSELTRNWVKYKVAFAEAVEGIRPRMALV